MWAGVEACLLSVSHGFFVALPGIRQGESDISNVTHLRRLRFIQGQPAVPLACGTMP